MVVGKPVNDWLALVVAPLMPVRLLAMADNGAPKVKLLVAATVAAEAAVHPQNVQDRILRGLGHLRPPLLWAARACGRLVKVTRDRDAEVQEHGQRRPASCMRPDCAGA